MMLLRLVLSRKVWFLFSLWHVCMEISLPVAEKQKYAEEYLGNVSMYDSRVKKISRVCRKRAVDRQEP